VSVRPSSDISRRDRVTPSRSTVGRNSAARAAGIFYFAGHAAERRRSRGFELARDNDHSPSERRGHRQRDRAWQEHRQRRTRTGAPRRFAPRETGRPSSCQGGSSNLSSNPARQLGTETKEVSSPYAERLRNETHILGYAMPPTARSPKNGALRRMRGSGDCPKTNRIKR
jgi:hypothetical protein